MTTTIDERARELSLTLTSKWSSTAREKAIATAMREVAEKCAGIVEEAKPETFGSDAMTRLKFGIAATIRARFNIGGG